MNHQQALDYIHDLERFGSKPGLERIRVLAERLGNPQEKLRFIHIAGTNGKGSTAAFLASVLRCVGYKTGLFTSPWLTRVHEMFRLNGRMISGDELAECTDRVKAAIDEMVQEGMEHPSQFEALTALGFLYFYEQRCDIVVLETGMGGRLDATNVIRSSEVSVITKIAMDHMAFLGDSLSAIALEKAGIIRMGGRVVTCPQEPSALEALETVCRNRNAVLYHADPGELTDISLTKGRMAFYHPRFGRIETSLVGVHQVQNAAIALKTVEVLNHSGYSIQPEHVREGFLNASWPGRFELLRTNPDFYVDGGHNPDGIRSFVDTFKRIYPGRKAIVIFGVMRDKDYELMVQELAAIAERFIAVTPDTNRALSAETLSKVMAKYCQHVECSDTIKKAVETALYLASADDIIASLGSLYYIGQVRVLAGAACVDRNLFVRNFPHGFDYKG